MSGSPPVRQCGQQATGTFNGRSGYTPRTVNRTCLMSDTYIIEVSSQAAGIVVRDRGGFRFFAATHRFNALEGQVFRNAREAERAARRLLDGELSAAA